MAGENPISGPYSAPASIYHAKSDKYSRVVISSATVNNPFTATGSFANPLGISTNDNTASVSIVFKNGSSITTADLAPGVIYPFDILIISGTYTAGKHCHIYY
jgi:hypothetical protein